MTLPDITRSRHRGSPESEAANRAAQPGKSYWQGKVWTHVLANGPATGEEIARALGVSWNRVSGRITELKVEGWLVDTGNRRETSTGCKAAVLRAVTSDEREAARATRGEQLVLMDVRARQ